MCNNILLTGTSGFVGKNLCNYLQKKGQYKLTDLNRVELTNPDIQINADVNAVIHLAGKAHDLKSVSNPNEYYEVNFELTKKLYDAFLLSSANKFIFISSVKATADTVNGILSESNLPDPQTHYGKSKLMAEEYIQGRVLPPGKSYYILRPCMIHGLGNKGNLNLLYQFVKSSIPYPLAAYDNKRSYLSVENLCFVINELLTGNDIESGAYQVADNIPLSTNEVISLLSSSLNKKPKLWHIPKPALKLVAKIGDILHLPLTTERLKKLTENYIVDNEKILKAINKTLPLTAQEGLLLTANSFSKK